MRFIIILIITLFSFFVGKSSPSDTVRYILNFNPDYSPSKDYLVKSMFYIYKQECGGYQVIFTFPDSYFWNGRLKIEIAIIDNLTGLASYGVIENVEKGRHVIVKPGEYTMIVVVSGMFVIHEETYFIELTQKK